MHHYPPSPPDSPVDSDNTEDSDEDEGNLIRKSIRSMAPVPIQQLRHL